MDFRPHRLLGGTGLRPRGITDLYLTVGTLTKQHDTGHGLANPGTWTNNEPQEPAAVSRGATGQPSDHQAKDVRRCRSRCAGSEAVATDSRRIDEGVLGDVVREKPKDLSAVKAEEEGLPAHAGKLSFKALQTVNVLLFAGGLFLIIAVTINLGFTIASYEAQGHSADGDVTRGPALVIITGLMTAVLAAVAFSSLRIGQRWACWIDVLIWSAGWLPAAINLNSYIRGFGYEISSLVCFLGVLLAVVTYFQMSPKKVPPRSLDASS